jgi:hypothetical protein
MASPIFPRIFRAAAGIFLIAAALGSGSAGGPAAATGRVQLRLGGYVDPLYPNGRHPEIGFAGRSKFLEHYAKHGREFPGLTRDEYLRLAQDLRDRKTGGGLIEFVREDRVITRFDRKTGAFLAFDRDLTIRTFFKPNDGEAYFKRQQGRIPRQP